VRGRMPTLELIHERFARYLRIGLFNFMQRSAEISLGSDPAAEVLSEFIRNLVVPTNLNLVARSSRCAARVLFVFDPNLVFLVIDNMFGGDGRFHTRVEGRDFTATEQRIIQRLLDVFFAEYERSWEPVFKIKLRVHALGNEFAVRKHRNAVGNRRRAATFYGRVGRRRSAEMHICLPYSMVEPLRDLLYCKTTRDLAQLYA
jgi:flagellar motor switch protein FliM